MAVKNKTLVLLDSHAIIHRAYHALPDFLSSAGEPTGALYGLSTMLMKIITELKPDYIVACYDLPQKTFRHEAYDAYKAAAKTAAELREAFEAAFIKAAREKKAIADTETLRFSYRFGKMAVAKDTKDADKKASGGTLKL